MILEQLLFFGRLFASEKVENMNQESGMSKLVKFFILIRFIPVRVGIAKASFKIFSCNTFIYILLFMGTIYLTCYVKLLSFKDFFMDPSSDLVFKISCAAFLLFLYLPFPLSPLLVANALPSATAITLAKDLNLPKNIVIFPISVYLSIFGGYLIEMGVWANKNEVLLDEKENGNSTDNEKNKVIKEAFLDFILPTIGNSLVVLCWIVPLLLVSTWMEKFIRLCKEDEIENYVAHSKICLDLYKTIQTVFGTFFFFVFSLSQSFVIFALFLSLSTVPRLSKEFGLKEVIYPAGMFCVSLALILNVVVLAFLLQNVNEGLKGLVKPLREELVVEHGKAERQRIKNIIKEIKEVGPLNGKGFFNITGSTLIGMLSVGYFYIMLLTKLQTSISSPNASH